jgi:acetyl esterase/lipase
MQVLVCFVVAVCASAGAAEKLPAGPKPSTVVLWPGKPPGETTAAAETQEPDQGDRVLRITNVSRPTMTVYPVDRGGAASPAVLVCPGGGYRVLAFDKEGTEVARWLNSLGVAAAVVKYRVPDNRAGALADAQRALGILRLRACEWDIDAGRVGVIGFSAGGHLAARLSNDHKKRSYSEVDQSDRLSCRPDFTILIYPAYLSGKSYRLAGEVAVTADTPQAFLVQTQDDRSYVNSSIAYYLALKKAGVAAELHLFPTGGHGYALRTSKHAVARWPDLCEAWLRERGVLSPRT